MSSVSEMVSQQIKPLSHFDYAAIVDRVDIDA